MYQHKIARVDDRLTIKYVSGVAYVATTEVLGPVITISSQPSNQTASAGAATFSVTASVTLSATLSYQWQRNPHGTGSFANVSGATSASLALTGLTYATNSADTYRCVVSATDNATPVTSSAATLTVAAPVITISSQPSNQTTSGTTATFSITASVTEGSVTYQWQRNPLGTGSFANISGATSASLALTGLSNASNSDDTYRCVVSATNASSVTSSSATLTVTSAYPLGAPVSPFTGDGTSSGTALSATGIFTSYSAARPTFTVATTGVVHYAWSYVAPITPSFGVPAGTVWASDTTFGIYRTRGGVTTAIYEMAGESIYGTAYSGTFSVNAGDVVRLGYPSEDTYISKFAIYWTAT